MEDLSFPGSGLGMTAHSLPVQRMMSVPLIPSPTAQMFSLEDAETPLSQAYDPGVGVGTWLHVEPFQCRARV
jgi:hypothetical protein